jgi:signal transduction histidine kinase
MEEKVFKSAEKDIFNRSIIMGIYPWFRIVMLFAFSIVAFSSQARYEDVVVFLLYFLISILSFKTKNKYFQTMFLIFDLAFIYYLSYFIGVHFAIAFSLIPVFASAIVDRKFSILVLMSGIVFIVLSPFISRIFALVAYVLSYISSFLLSNEMKEREKLQAKLREEKEFTEKFFIAKRLSMEFAHELRNPLMSISGAVEILKEAKDKDDDAKKKMFEILEYETKRISQMTSDFMNLGKGANLKMERVNVLQFLKESKLTIQNPMGIEIKMDVSDDVNIKADKEKIKQIFSNFLLNSFEAGAKKVNIKSYKNNDKVVFEIKDDGQGVADEIKDNIFKPFFSTKSYGTGLGLSISKRFVELHSGKIYLKDKNTVVVELPYG